MNKLLFVNCCLRGKNSRTLRLARRLLEEYRFTHPNVVISELALDQLHLSPTDSHMLRQRDMALGQWQMPLFDLARQFLETDLVVLAAPFWNGSFPALLHTYLEHICVPGLTFDCVDELYTGLCRAKACVLVTTRGGTYENGSMLGSEHATPLLESIMKMLGVNRVETLAAEGIDLSYKSETELMNAAMKNAALLAKTLP